MNKFRFFPLLLLLGGFCSAFSQEVLVDNFGTPYDSLSVKIPREVCDTLEIDLIIPTFLGNEKRNYYGNEAPDELNIRWKYYLGSGSTVVSGKEILWSGAGWTGQPLLVEEYGHLYIIQGSYSHNLYKINALTGEKVWAYKFDDVIKGTGTIFKNCNAKNPRDAYIILQGSRRGLKNKLYDLHIPSYRAVSYLTGQELWRMDVAKTPCYSRDVDASALILEDTAYIGLENSLFTVFLPDPDSAILINGMMQPKLIQQLKLYSTQDAIDHRNNIVTEASPAKLGSRVYVASGAGYIWGYNLKTRRLDWKFSTGSDMDGSTIVTYDSCIISTIEKQYIRGKGGAIKLDPSKNPDSAVIWYFPVDDKRFASWQGGIIGSASVNDMYAGDSLPYLSAFCAMDGHLYVVKHNSVSDSLVKGFDGLSYYPSPEQVFKYKIGSSIASPVMVGNKIIATTYSGIYLFEYDNNMEFKLLDKYHTTFEATPVVWDRKIYVASRDGYLYCFGD